MGIDWEEILGAEGADLADAYDAYVADAIEAEERLRRDYIPVAPPANGDLPAFADENFLEIPCGDEDAAGSDD